MQAVVVDQALLSFGGRHNMRLMDETHLHYPEEDEEDHHECHSLGNPVHLQP